MKRSQHWMDVEPDPNIRRSKEHIEHINRIRISADSLIKILELKAQLLGKRLDVLKEAQAFEDRVYTY